MYDLIDLGEEVYGVFCENTGTCFGTGTYDECEAIEAELLANPETEDTYQ